MNEIDNEIYEQYNLDIKSIVPQKDVYILNTSKGKKILRKTILSQERILFIHGVKEYLFEHDFKKIDRYICSKEGKPSFIYGKNVCTITDSIEGNECNFDNKQEIIKSSRLLAEMHRASRGFSAPSGCVPRDELGKLPQYFGKRLEEIKKLKKFAKKEKNRFDYLFLQYFDYFYELGEKALEQVTSETYNNVVELARKQGIICHHDFTHSNIISSGDQLSLINFDYCCFELKIYDIANFLRRKMRKCNWDANEAKIIIDEYKKIEPISSEEFILLKQMLQFPQKFWRVINKYYNSKRSWSEKSFIVRLQEVIDEIPYNKQFLDRFDSIID